MDRSILKDIGLYKKRLAEAFLGSEAICRGPLWTAGTARRRLPL